MNIPLKKQARVPSQEWVTAANAALVAVEIITWVVGVIEDRILSKKIQAAANHDRDCLP